MKLIRMLFGLTLIAASAVTADAAVTIRTAPANPPAGGVARCLVANGGATLGSASMTLFSFSADVAVATNADVPVGANQTGFGTEVSTNSSLGSNPSWCECVVPNRMDFRCSYIVLDSGNVTVVPAQ